MSRTYEIEERPSGLFRILSNGKPLKWVYPKRWIAEEEIRRLRRQAEEKARRKELYAKAGLVRPRDSKRSKVYKMERAIGLVGGAALVATPEQMRQLCVQWAHAAGYHAVVPRVRWSSRKRRGSASCYFTEITLSQGSCLGTLIHEYAHAITWDEQPAHGPRWAKVYVGLVRVAMGDELADRLEAGFQNLNLIPRAA